MPNTPIKNIINENPNIKKISILCIFFYFTSNVWKNELNWKRGNPTIKKRKYKKYENVKSWPKTKYGSSIGLKPIQPNKIQTFENDQKDKTFQFSKKEALKNLFVANGNKNNINIAKIKVLKPPNLLGIERSIAWNGRKYHSGTIWVGVTNGLAGILFTGSIMLSGLKKTK